MITNFCAFLAKTITINNMYINKYPREIIDQEIEELNELISRLSPSQMRASVKLMMLIQGNKESWESSRHISLN